MILLLIFFHFGEVTQSIDVKKSKTLSKKLETKEDVIVSYESIKMWRNKNVPNHFDQARPIIYLCSGSNFALLLESFVQVYLPL